MPDSLNTPDPPESRDSPELPDSSGDGSNVHRYLRSLDRDGLEQLILDLTSRSDHLVNILQARAAAVLENDSREASLRRMITDLTDEEVYVGYRGIYRYAEEVGEVIRALDSHTREHLNDGNLSLIEWAIRRFDDALLRIRDSGGVVWTEMSRLFDIHCRICQETGIAPDELVRSLLRLGNELNIPPDTKRIAACFTILSDTDRERFRHILQTLWEHVPVLGPDDEWSDFTTPSGEEVDRHFLAHLMEQIAREISDIDLLIDVLERDLRAPRQYTAIVRILYDAGRLEEALDWARRGSAIFPGSGSGFLASQAQIFSDLDRREEAIDAARNAFRRSPDPEYWSLLRRICAGSDRSDEIRIWAYQTAEEHIEEMGFEPDPIILMLMVDRQYVDAFERAQADGCSVRTRTMLMNALSAEHPDLALEAAEHVLQDLLKPVNNDAYRRTVEHLKLMHGFMQLCDRTDEWPPLLSHLRETCKRRKNFIALLDENWPPDIHHQTD